MDFQEPWSSMALLVLFYEKKGLNPSSPTCENWTIKQQQQKKKKKPSIMQLFIHREREREKKKKKKKPLMKSLTLTWKSMAINWVEWKRYYEW